MVKLFVNITNSNKMDECITQIILYNGKLTREEKDQNLEKYMELFIQ